MKIYTIKDIAQKAGVSVTTVSRVLNKRPDVNQATREKVERVMEECHFVGNANARGLKQTDSENVAIILRGRENPFLNSLAEAVLLYTHDHEASFLVEYVDETADEFQTAVRLHHEKRVTGCIFLGGRIDERARVLEGIDMPMVFATISAEKANLPRAGSVFIDNRMMGRLAMQTLIDAGHTKIAIFGGARQSDDGFGQRYQGAMEALEKAGIPFDGERYVDTRFSLRGAYDTARGFFAMKPDTTAVFAMSDTVAMGVAGETPRQWFERLGEKIVHCHFSDGRPYGHLVWGDGVFPLERYLDVLNEFGYEGMLGQEITDGRYLEDPKAADRRNFHAFERFFAREEA